jgi:hypothetical protein
LILGTYYCPGLPCCLLSLQHWTQKKEDNLPKKGGTICEILHWSQQQFQLTVPLDKASNVAYIQTSAGFSKLHVCSTIIGKTNDHIKCYDIHVIPPDDKELQSTSKIIPPPPDKNPPDDTANRMPEGAALVDFDILPDAHNLIKRGDLELENSQDKLYQWHLKLRHILFSSLKIMALKGNIPKTKVTCKLQSANMCSLSQ